MGFYSRRHRAVVRVRAAESGRTSWGIALCAMHGWHGHMLRDACGPAGQSLRWRGLRWWRTIQFLGPPSDHEAHVEEVDPWAGASCRRSIGT